MPYKLHLSESSDLENQMLLKLILKSFESSYM